MEDLTRLIISNERIKNIKNNNFREKFNTTVTVSANLQIGQNHSIFLGLVHTTAGR